MAKNKTGHAAWFKVFLYQQAIFDAVPAECVGRAIKAVLRYINTGQLPDDLDETSNIVFAALKPSADASIDSYEKASEAGKKGNAKRWKSRVVSGSDTSRHKAIPGDRVVSGGIEKIEDRRNNTDASAVPGLGAGEQQNAYKDLFLDPESGEWRRRSNE